MLGQWGDGDGVFLGDGDGVGLRKQEELLHCFDGPSLASRDAFPDASLQLHLMNSNLRARVAFKPFNGRREKSEDSATMKIVPGKSFNLKLRSVKRSNAYWSIILRSSPLSLAFSRRNIKYN